MRANEWEHHQVHRIAADQGVTVSDLIRRALVAEGLELMEEKTNEKGARKPLS
jgi:16S rRNA U516 pseudouridylate synthase RsuA-like enzyme